MKKLGIKYQLRLTTLIPVLIAALLFAFFYNTELRKDSDHQISKLGEGYIRQTLPAAQSALIKNDRKALQGLANDSTVNPEIKSLAFYDAKGHLIAYRGGKHPLSTAFKAPDYVGDYIEKKQIQPYLINFVTPITMSKLTENSVDPDEKNKKPLPAEDILGWASLDMDTQSIHILQYQMIILSIVISLIVLLISLLVDYLFSRQIYLPIARLRRSMKQILRNEFETKISATSEGELGDIEKGCVNLQKHYLNATKELSHHVEIATADLQQSLELLEERNIQLSIEKKKMEDKSKQQSEFIANMTHEIRTPMNGVIGFTNILLESKLDIIQLDYVRTIKTSAENLLTIINDILDYTKIDSDKLNLDCIPLDLRTCIDEVLALIVPNAHKKDISLIPSTEINVPKMVLGDPLRIKQIIMNLVSNAVKFTDQGYVLIHTAVEGETDQDYIFRISITDTGIGISKDAQTKLFNAFNQADTSITRRFGGTGLGLVICKRLVEAMHGSISLNSRLKKGSTFTVKLKLEKLAGYESEKYQNYLLPNIQALCFDDNPLELEALCNGLEHLGVKSIPVSAITQLKETFKKNKDCSIAFVTLTKENEKDLAKIIKKENMPCVLVAKHLVHNPESLGASAFLFKPIIIKKLQDTIQSILKLKPANTNLHQELEDLRNQLKQIHPKILIAEDNPVNRLLLNSLLSDYAELDAVENGKEAVLSCQNKRYQLILLDLQMPLKNGLEAAREIREESLLNEKTPIIVISANNNDLDQRQLGKIKIDLFLQKPIDETELFRQLLQTLEKNKPNAIDWDLCVSRLSGNETLATEFLDKFVAELKLNRIQFLDLFNNLDIQGLAREAHKLHGACCFCGVPELQDRVKQLELLATDAKQLDELNLIFPELIQSMDEVIQEYNKHYANFKET